MPQAEPILSIRKLAKPDTLALIDLHLQAFAGYPNALLGKRYLRAFFGYFRDKPTAIALVAVADLGLAGYVIGDRIGYGSNLRRRIAVPALISVLGQPQLIGNAQFRAALLRQLPFGRKSATSAPAAVPELPQPTYSLVGIGVASACRGRRIGQQLMAQFEDAARNQAAGAVRLSVYGDNLAARALYERQGWQTAEANVSGHQLIYYHKLL